MPAARTPDGWVRCRFASLEFDLPRGLAEGFQTGGKKPKGAAVLKHGARAILLFPPESAEELVESFDESTAGLPELQELSPARLYLAMYEASWDDFRWTMSREALAKHAWLVEHGALDHAFNPQKVETLFRDDVEALLVVRGWDAEFHWWSTDGRTWGVITFIEESGDIGLSWVRPVCHSLRYSGQSFPDKMTHDELNKAFRILEP